VPGVDGAVVVVGTDAVVVEPAASVSRGRESEGHDEQSETERRHASFWEKEERDGESDWKNNSERKTIWKWHRTPL
jgi:hypothetical protein